MAFGKIFSELKARLRAKGRRPGAAPRPSLSADEQQFVADMLAGMTAQVVHEGRMQEARGNEPVSLRLVPQVPLRDLRASVGWIGGGACLPAGTPWPEIAGSPLQLLAQFDCARLPAGLWRGLGPRRGWLAIFVDPISVEARVLHFPVAGAFEPSPAIRSDCNIIGYDGRKRVESSGGTWSFPRWPIDVVPVFHGRNDPRSEQESQIRHVRYGLRHDFVEDRRWPFDWPTAQMMMATVLAAYENAVPAGAASHSAPEALAKSELAIKKAETSGASADELLGLRLRHEEFRAMAARREFAIEHGAAVCDRLRELKAKVDAMSASRTFSPSAIEPVLAGLQGLKWMHMSVPPFYRDGRKLTERQRLEEGVKIFALPLTAHDPSANPGWVHEFETRLLEVAKMAYLNDPASLPPPLVADCEQVWRDEAAAEMVGIGHVPWKYVHEFDDASDETLIELPSSSLIGWQFGDVDNLVITVKRADLARGDFSRPFVQITN